MFLSIYIMGLGSKEILVVDKKEYIGFSCSPQLKTDFTRAISEMGEYNTYSGYFLDKMREYIKAHKDLKTHG